MKILKIAIFLLLASLTSAKDMKIYATYEVAAIKDSLLSMALPGIVDKIYVKVGDKVKSGQQLLSLQNSERKLELSGLKTQLDFAKTRYERFKKAKGAIDKNTLESHLASYKKLESDYALAQDVLAKTTLKAPFDGIIAENNAVIGQALSGYAMRLISESKKLIILFDSRYIDSVKVGSSFALSSGKEVQITQIYPTINPKNQKITAIAEIKPNSAMDTLLVGSFGDGYINTQVLKSSKVEQGK